MTSAPQQLHAYLTAWRVVALERLRDDRGEGVISTAIAVLIVAFVGVAAFAVFRGVMNNAGTRANEQVNQIGAVAP